MQINVNLFRVILCVLIPPLSVIDRGCGSFILVLILTFIGWAPGVIGAFIILSSDGSINKKFENSFLVTFLSVIVFGFVILVVIYVLFIRR